MKNKIYAAAAALLLLTACSENDPPEVTSEPVSATVTEPAIKSDFDLNSLTKASATSALLKKYGSFNVKTEMDYGERIVQNSSFFLNADGTFTYINTTGDSSEYFDGKNDYWQELSEDGESATGSAYLSLPGAAPFMDLENYIFMYSSDDGIIVTDYTQNKDGGYIISAAENYNYSYEDANGETVNISYKYEYVIGTTPDLEVQELKSSCTDLNTGETGSALDVSVSFGAEPADIPEFMNETFEITVIVISGENEVTATYEVPEGFQPLFSEPADGNYGFYYDRDGTQPIEDTMAIDSPCMIYAIKE